ncbi:MAG: TetR/AcrR family transcriptional regulator [Nitrospirota bacterium]|nr:TetR/AcrR family transcriptional regulator [Nitrospirota bacterium]
MKITATRQKILDSAVLLVSEKGYLGATTREIAKKAGVTELTLFRHFGTKEKLFGSIMGSNSFLPALREILPDLEEMSYAEALEMLGTRFLLSLKERKPFVKIMQSEMTRYPAEMRRVYGHFMDDMLGTLALYFESLQRKGQLRDFSPTMASRMFMGMLFSYFRTEEIMRNVDITRGKRMNKAVAEFVDIFVHGTLPRTNGTVRRKRS